MSNKTTVKTILDRTCKSYNIFSPFSLQTFQARAWVKVSLQVHMFICQTTHAVEKEEHLSHQQTIETLQMRINKEFNKLGLPHYIRIDDYSIPNGIFEYTILLRYGFVTGEDTNGQAHEIAERLLKNPI